MAIPSRVHVIRALFLDVFYGFRPVEVEDARDDDSENPEQAPVTDSFDEKPPNDANVETNSSGHGSCVSTAG